MECKALAFGLGDTRKHAHLYDDHSGKDLRNRHDWTTKVTCQHCLQQYRQQGGQVQTDTSPHDICTRLRFHTAQAAHATKAGNGTEEGTYFPHSPQKHLSTTFPLPVSRSTYFFITPFSSSTLTFSFSIARFDDTNDPATLRQFAQWHRWPRGRVKSSSSVMVTRMDLQRQVALREEENSETSWEFGSPVRLEGSAIVCNENGGVVPWVRYARTLSCKRPPV